jgi:hypothetical protein
MMDGYRVGWMDGWMARGGGAWLELNPKNESQKEESLENEALLPFFSERKQIHTLSRGRQTKRWDVSEEQIEREETTTNSQPSVSIDEKHLREVFQLSSHFQILPEPGDEIQERSFPKSEEAGDVGLREHDSMGEEVEDLGSVEMEAVSLVRFEGLGVIRRRRLTSRVERARTTEVVTPSWSY